jgi:hypothetical protein
MMPFCFGPPTPGHQAWNFPPWINWEHAPQHVKQLRAEKRAGMLQDEDSGAIKPAQSAEE